MVEKSPKNPLGGVVMQRNSGRMSRHFKIFVECHFHLMIQLVCFAHSLLKLSLIINEQKKKRNSKHCRLYAKLCVKKAAILCISVM